MQETYGNKGFIHLIYFLHISTTIIFSGKRRTELGKSRRIRSLVRRSVALGGADQKANLTFTWLASGTVCPMAGIFFILMAAAIHRIL